MFVVGFVKEILGMVKPFHCGGHGVGVGVGVHQVQFVEQCAVVGFAIAADALGLGYGLAVGDAPVQVVDEFLASVVVAFAA